MGELKSSGIYIPKTKTLGAFAIHVYILLLSEDNFYLAGEDGTYLIPEDNGPPTGLFKQANIARGTYG